MARRGRRTSTIANGDEARHSTVRYLSEREIAEHYPPERVEQLLQEANHNAEYRT
jgi:hypothetical protein